VAVTRASEHTPTGLDDDRHCSQQQVMLWLRRVAADDANQTLLAWMSAGERQTDISLLIPDARSQIRSNSWAGCDFDYHEDVAVALDGNNLESMNLANLGFSPLVDVTAITISNSVEDTDDYRWYSEGRLDFASVESATYLSWYSGPVFPWGTQNVELTITWGYETCPYDIQMAQAMVVAASLLQMLQQSDGVGETVAGSMQQIQYGDLRISMGNKNGAYAYAIDNLMQGARERCLRYRDVITTSATPTFPGGRGTPSRLWSGW